MMEMKSYYKAELAQMYFPMVDAQLAMRRLRRWIRMNPDLEKALAQCHVSKNADYYSRKQVSLIVEYFDEP